MFLGESFAHAFRTVRTSKRMLLLVGLADFLVCLPPAVHVLRKVHAASANRPDALDLAKHLDLDFMADLRQRDGSFDADLTTLVVASALLFFFVRPFVSAAYVGLAASPRRMHLGHFVKEGGALYWKFLRLAVLALCAAYLISIASAQLLDKIAEWARTRSEPTAIRYGLVTNLVLFGAFSSLVAIVFDYARVGLRLDRRPGVFMALWRAVLFVLQHPMRTLLMYVAALALELGAVYLCGWLLQLTDGGYFTTSAIVLVLIQFVITLREAARLFHVAGAWHIRRAEASEEEARVVVPEGPDSDVLRAPLPWNVR